MKKLYFLLVLAIASFSFSSCDNCCCEKKAKYVFYFIGDGMGFCHVSASEAYLAYVHEGKIGREPLSFTKFPVLGMVSTYSASNDITCSSASGTALATGTKTNNHFLGVTPDTTNLTSIAYKIHDTGIPVGIMTTVSIDHATPASFYANSVSRSDYYTIAKQLAKTDFEFFGGGGLLSPTGKKKDQPSAYDMIEEEGYTIAAGLDEYAAKKDASEKMVLLQKQGRQSKELPYAIDRKEGDLTLSDILRSAIDYLTRDKEEGFFIMAEGGLIDWAAHSNDGKTVCMEVADLSDAVAVAYEFYLKHPKETLIIVTADHETGGISLGYKSGYQMFFEEFASQVSSKDSSVTAASYENVHTKSYVDDLNKEVRVGWTTGSHTGGNVPVFAVGAGSALFGGEMDNTDIPKKICSAMGINF